ncbi:MAG: hypothetical protein QM783_15195 [Phycisphaerales bacterium]
MDRERDHALRSDVAGAAERIAISRRQALKFGATAAAAVAGVGALGGGSRQTVKADTATVSLTEGPFWVDERLNRSDIRSDPANNNTMQAGLPLRLAISVSRLTNGVPTPIPNAWVDIWHANGAGAYSDVSGSGNPNNVGQKWLRGYQISDAHGMVKFTTIYPGWYIGRATHIHARIRIFAAGSTTTTLLNFTTQFFFVEATNAAIYARLASTYNHTGSRTLNASDGIYNTSGAGAAAILRMADDNTHAVASFNIKLNTTAGLVRAYSHDDIELACEDDHAFDFGGGTPPMAMRALYESAFPLIEGGGGVPAGTSRIVTA